MRTPLEQAHRLLALGFSVIPVPRPRPGVPPGQPGDGKVPIIAWREFQTRLPTPREIDVFFGGDPMNLAVVTGAVSDRVFVDIDDVDEALRHWTGRAPYTPLQTKTPRGYHLGYRHPGVRVPNRARIETPDGRLAIDVRGDGGYVIAPGSIHASGAEYLEAGDWDVPREQIPRFWPGWLARPTLHSAPREPLARPVGNVVTRARAYLAAIPRPEIGSGSDAAVLSAACRMTRGFDLDPADAEALVWEWAGGRPGWTREWVARKVAHALRYGTEAIGGLR